MEHGGRLRILLVDDDPDARLLLCALLEAWLGADVVAVEGVDEALRALSRARAGAIVCDGHLRGESALDLARAVKEGFPALAVPLVVVTADEDPAFARHLLEAGVDAVLGKPPDAAALARHLGATMAGDG